MSLLRASFTVSFWTAASRVLGFLRDIVMANKLGAGAASDAFFVALILPNLLRRLFAEGAFNVAFVPLLSAEKSKSDAAALKFASSVFTALVGVLITVTILAEIFMPQLVNILAPGFVGDAERFDLTVSLGRITFPYLMLISGAAFMGAICNTWGRFAAYAAVPALLNIAFLGCLLILPTYDISPVKAATIAVPLGGVLQVLFMMNALKRVGVRLTFGLPKHALLSDLWRRLGPAALGVGVLQISFLIDNFLASFLGSGAISYLQYANRFYQFPLALIGIATATVLLPHLSKTLAAGHKKEASAAFSKAFVGAMALGLGAFVGLFVLAEELLATVLQHGAFTTDAAQLTAWAMMGYAAGLPGYILTKLTATAFFAAGDTKTPVKASVLALGVNIIANVILMQYFGHVGIAVATAISGWVNALFQLSMLQKRQVVIIEFTTLMRPLTKALVVGLVMGACLALYKNIFAYGGGIIQEGLWLVGAIGLGGILFLMGVEAAGVLPVRKLARRILGR